MASVNTVIANAVLEGKKTLVHLACEEGNVKTLRLLTDAKVDLELKDDEGQTPLMVACRYQKIECFTLLLECGADPNVKDAQEQPLLHMACAQLNPPYVRLLLAHGADPEILDESRNTPLHVIFRNPEVEIVRLLLEKGANPNAQNNLGNPPMDEIWKNFYPFRETIDSVRLLLEHGANVDHLGSNFENVLIKACRKKSPSLVRLFLKYGASCANRALVLVTERLQRASGCDKRGVALLEECKELLTEHLAPTPKKRSRTEVEEDEEEEAEEPSTKRIRFPSGSKEGWDCDSA